MEPIVKKQLFHGLRIFSIVFWAIVALIASSVCWQEGTTVGGNVFGVLNLLIHAIGIFFAVKYDVQKEKEEV